MERHQSPLNSSFYPLPVKKNIYISFLASACSRTHTCLTSSSPQQDIWSWLQLKPRTLNPLRRRRQILSQQSTCQSSQRARARAQPASSRRPSGTASAHLGATGSYWLVTGNGMCLFSGSCALLVIRGSRLSCPLALHTLEALRDRRARASRQTRKKGRRRAMELRQEPECALTHTHTCKQTCCPRCSSVTGTPSS